MNNRSQEWVQEHSMPGNTTGAYRRDRALTEAIEIGTDDGVADGCLS